jgi:hypothetical protein
LIAFVDAFHNSKSLHSGENWVLLSKSVKSEKDFEGAMTLVELLGLEKEDLVGCYGRLFKKSMERMHTCFRARLFDQCWFVTIRDDKNDELDGLVPTHQNIFRQDASTAPLKRAFAGIKNKIIQDVPRHVPVVATLPDPAIAEAANVPVPDALSTPITVFRRHSIFTPDKAPILREFAKKGNSITVPSLNNQDRKFFYIPKCTTAKSAASSLKKDGLLKEITTTLGSGLTSPEGYDMGPFFLADAIAKQDIGAFEAAAKNNGINFHQRMSAVKTSAMWVDARLTKASQRPVSDHLAAHFDGKQVTANEKEVDKIGRENQKTTRVFDTYSFTTRVGKKSCAEDVTAQARDVTVNYWTSCPHEVAQKELMARVSSGKKVEGIEFPLVDQNCIAMSFLADHGNVAWRAGLTLISDEDDGQGKVTPVAHLLAKDEYALLKESGIAAVLDKGIVKLQASALLVVTNDSGVSEAAMVPRNAFVDTVAEPFEQLFLETPVDSGNINQNVIIEGAWDALENTGSLVYDSTAEDIRGVAWQNAEHEKVQVDFQRTVPFSLTDTKLKVFPVVVLGGGDTQWISCALGKENYDGVACNHCKQKHLGDGIGELWTLESLKEAAATYDGIRSEAIANGKKTLPTGHNGVKAPPLFSIPVHLWPCAVLHDMLGLVLDAVRRMENFNDKTVEMLPEAEISARETMVQRVDELKVLLYEINQLAPFVEQSKNCKQMLKDLNKGINARKRKVKVGRKTVIVKAVPTKAEYDLQKNLTFQIEMSEGHRQELAEEVKSKKEAIRLLQKRVTQMRKERGIDEDSGAYAIDKAFTEKGVDRSAYFNNSFIGPHIRKMLEFRKEIIEQQEEGLLKVLKRSQDSNQRDIASETEVKEEMEFFGDILHCYDAIFGILRKVKTMYGEKEISELKEAIRSLKDLWPTQRHWETKIATCTPKGHDIWFHALLQIIYLGRFYHFMEDPIEKLHKEEKLLDRTYCHFRSYEKREEAKAVRSALADVPAVRAQIDGVKKGKKRTFSVASTKKKVEMKEEVEEKKAARRSFEGTKKEEEVGF